MFSFVAHGIFLLAGNQKHVTSHEVIMPEARNPTKLTLPPPPVAKEPPRQQTPQELVPPSSKPQMADLEEIVETPATTSAKQEGDFSDVESDYLPELRLIWDSPDQLIHVAKASGMRILLVNRKNEPVGEMLFDNDLSVKPFKGRLTDFSNRVRSISAQFFGEEILQQSQEPVHCFWVLVPASIDRDWVSVQRDAIRARGLSSSDISYMEARVVLNDESCQLVVTRIVAG